MDAALYRYTERLTLWINYFEIEDCPKNQSLLVLYVFWKKYNQNRFRKKKLNRDIVNRVQASFAHDYFSFRQKFYTSAEYWKILS